MACPQVFSTTVSDMLIPSASFSHDAQVPQVQPCDFQGSSLIFSDIKLLSPDPRGKPFGSFVDCPGRQLDLGHQLAEPCHEGFYPIIKKYEEKVLCYIFRRTDENTTQRNHYKKDRS